MVQRKATSSVSIETYRKPFELQSTVLESAADAEALAGALNARALRLAAATATPQGTAEAVRPSRGPRACPACTTMCTFKRVVLPPSKARAPLVTDFVVDGRLACDLLDAAQAERHRGLRFSRRPPRTS